MNETQAADAASHKKGKQLPQSGFMAHHVMLAFFFQIESSRLGRFVPS